MAGLSGNRKIQVGAEATLGTAVPATTIWRGGLGGIEDASEWIAIPDKPGILIPTDRTAKAALLARLAMPAEAATFQQLGYFLEAGIKKVTPTQDGAGSDYIYDYLVGLTSVNTPRSYTIESGDNIEVKEMEYSLCESFAISGGAKELVKMAGNWFGRQVTVSAFTGALSVPAVEEIKATSGSLAIDAVSGSFGGTPVAAGNLLRFNLAVTTGWIPKFTMDSGELYFVEHVFDEETFEAVLELTFRHNTSANTEEANWRAGTSRLIQLLFEGSAFGTGGTTYSNHTLIINICGRWDKFNPIEAEEGDTIITGTFKCGYNETAAKGLQIIVVNELSALP